MSENTDYDLDRYVVGRKKEFAALSESSSDPIAKPSYLYISRHYADVHELIENNARSGRLTTSGELGQYLISKMNVISNLDDGDASAYASMSVAVVKDILAFLENNGDPTKSAIHREIKKVLGK